jgi:hypothetical protein
MYATTGFTEDEIIDLPPCCPILNFGVCVSLAACG